MAIIKRGDRKIDIKSDLKELRSKKNSNKKKFVIVTLFILVITSVVCSASWIYQTNTQKKDLQYLYRFMIDNEQIEQITSSIKDKYVYHEDIFFGLVDMQYSTENRIKIVEILLNHQKIYTKAELLNIYLMIGVSEGKLENSISNHQKIIDFYLSLVVAMRDRKNEEVIQLLDSYYSEKGEAMQDNLFGDIESTKEKIASLIGVNWMPWWKQ
ncbi:hypothetical protein HGO21_03265 [Acinetobacter sp. CUI P1]|nr:hypothetical protein [Acinetobacter sp. CUI P1]